MLSSSFASRKAPRHSEMKSAMTGVPRKVMIWPIKTPLRAVWLMSVLARIRSTGRSRIVKDRPALGSFSVLSSSVKSAFSSSLPALILASILSSTASCASVYLLRSISYGTTRLGYFLPNQRNRNTEKMNRGMEISRPAMMNRPRSMAMPSFWNVLTTARGPGVGGIMKCVMYRPMPRMPPRQTMDFLVRRENSLAREDRMTKPESQKTGIDTTTPERPRTTSACLTPTSFRMVMAMRLAAPLFSRNMPMIPPKPITMPMLAMVLPKPDVTVLMATLSRLPLSFPVPASR